MPEGPEIRRDADRIGRVLAGRHARSIWFAFEHLRDWSQVLRRRVIRCVEARGKAMLIRFDAGLNVYSHNQLYGRWYVTPRGQVPRTGRQLRLAVETDAHSALLYSASEIDVLRDASLPDIPFSPGWAPTFSGPTSISRTSGPASTTRAFGAAPWERCSSIRASLAVSGTTFAARFSSWHVSIRTRVLSTSTTSVAESSPRRSWTSRDGRIDCAASRMIPTMHGASERRASRDATIATTSSAGNELIAYVAERELLRQGAAAELVANDYVVRRAKRQLQKRQ